MFYKSSFGKSQQNRNVKLLQQTKVPQKLSQQIKVRMHQQMDEENYIKRQQQLQLPNTSSTVYNKFYVNLQNTVLVDDPTIAWVSPALIPIKNQRARNLFIKKQSYLITSYYGTDYPRSFWLTSPQVNGYLDNTGAVTHKLSNMSLVNVSSNVDESGQKFSDLLYAQQDQVTWQLPLSGAPITFQIMLDSGQVLQMPLPNGIGLNFEIRQIGI